MADGVIFGRRILARAKCHIERLLALLLIVCGLSLGNHLLLLVAHAVPLCRAPVRCGNGVVEPLLTPCLLSLVDGLSLGRAHDQVSSLVILPHLREVPEPLETRRFIARLLMSGNGGFLIGIDRIRQGLAVLTCPLVVLEPLEPGRFLVGLDLRLVLSRLGNLFGARVVALGHLGGDLDLFHACKFLLRDCPLRRLGDVIVVARPVEPLDPLGLLGFMHARVVGVFDTHL
mmetsp:Transcript_23515/g.66115  ORF Transcript_23515/g.66115 Transcript_23515/m.66115 type:complete len:230 (+) Transcript_23515:334-1023(+)